MPAEWAIPLGVLAVIMTFVTILLSLRSWFYGGSVIRVELELGKQDWQGMIVTGSVYRWKHNPPKMQQGAVVLDPMHIDLVKLTVRNFGRTPATVLNPGLRIGSPPVPRRPYTAHANILLDIGTQDDPARIEAHDSKTFYFPLIPLIRAARDDLGNSALAVRGSIETGTGKNCLSRRWWRGRWNVIQIPKGTNWIGSEPTLVSNLWLWRTLTGRVIDPPGLGPFLIRDVAQAVSSYTDDDTLRTAIEEAKGRYLSQAASHEERAWADAMITEARKQLSQQDPAG